jgi:hypothetical protein
MDSTPEPDRASRPRDTAGDAVSPYLAIYLRDHHAMGRAGTALARRAAAGAELAFVRQAELAAVAGEIAQDLASLEAIMSRLGVDPSAVKDSVALAGERLGRLKSNGTVVARSPLSSVVELESLVAGITSKQGMWRALALLASRDDRLDSAVLERLTARAERQLQVVEACRIEAAANAFGAVDAQAAAS